MNANADDYLKGSWDNWNEEEWTNCKFSYSNETTGTVTLNLSAGKYTFKFVNGSTWMGNTGTMTYSNCTNWTFSSNTDDCTLEAPVAGSYTFTVTWSGSIPSISVTYPSGKVTVYFCDDINWNDGYAYILGSSYWDDTNGSGSSNRSNGIQMSQIEGTNIWKAEYTLSSATSYIAFVKCKQDDYGNFYDTEAVYREDFNAGTPLYVPNTTSSGTYNQGKTKYYSNGEWHAYPTYTRSVTEGNFGTICLPFAATVTGATVFKITSQVKDASSNLTGINLESVETLEAGKAYIFKATGSTLTATYSGSYTAATEDNGMMGNLSSTEATVPVDNYVVSGNKICKVVSGDEGDAVTVGQYKGYITLKDIEEASARGADFIDFDNEATGISQVEKASRSADSYFNLAGQRVAQPTKGLYIVNGKKVLR